MSVSYKYWDDCVNPEDLRAMWNIAAVSKEWTDAGEKRGEKVLLSRDPDGQQYLTQTEMKAVSAIVVCRHFKLQLDVDMLCAIAETSSDRQILAQNYNKKTKETKVGIMQFTPETAKWLVREMGYKNYEIEGDPALLFRPFVNVYFGAAYIKCLFSSDGKERTEEFVVRAYRGGIKKAKSKSTAEYFQRYLDAKQNFLPISFDREEGEPANNSYRHASSEGSTYWDLRVSPQDMEELWRHPEVLREWTKSAERRGYVRFSQDPEKRPYLSRVEVKAVAEIIVSRYFSSLGVLPIDLAALAETCSFRFVNGIRSRTGVMGIDYPTAAWLYRDVGYKAYEVTSVDDLYNPFVSMYFGASYWAWLSEYEGRARSLEFIVQAYLGGPENVNLQETGPHWKNFQVALIYYKDPEKGQGNCCIL